MLALVSRLGKASCVSILEESRDKRKMFGRNRKYFGIFENLNCCTTNEMYSNMNKIKILLFSTYIIYIKYSVIPLI